jgi:hypothetical protein
MIKDSKQAAAHFYQGADGPTILLLMPTQVQIGEQKSIFMSLAEGKSERVNLRESRITDDIQGFHDVLFTLVAGQREPSRMVREMERTMRGLVFELRRVSGGWHECAKLLDALNRPGHQYLNRGTSDEAVILVSFQESLQRS